jgi:hypothetical protein
LRRFFLKLGCAAFGHNADNLYFATQQDVLRKCQCGAPMLMEDGSKTQVSHNLSCFFFGHSYWRMGERDGYCEFVCKVCGHPLLFHMLHLPYADKDEFHKKARYLCILFGHPLHTVAERNGLIEYACDCGHSFLKQEKRLISYRHPLVCVFKGHFISFVERRMGYAEYRCGNCGHPFCFITPR